MQNVASAGRSYTVDEAARFLRVLPATVRRWLKEGFIKGAKTTYGQGRRERWRIEGREVRRVQSIVYPTGTVAPAGSDTQRVKE